jgi:2-octaprenyl-6-methoxyphenol hydroxylase
MLSYPGNQASTDVLIVGGGPVGATLALALAQGSEGGGPLAVTVLEAQQDFSALPDARTLALSHGSRLILERIGIWQQLSNPTPITRIHVSQRGAFGRAVLSAEDASMPALGYVLNYADLQQALHAALAQAPVRYLTGTTVEEVHPNADAPSVACGRDGGRRTITGRLLAIADGGRSLGSLPGVKRESRDYGQCAVVCQVRTERSHDGLAYERFTPQGPAALLPYQDRYALVWTASPQQAEEMLAWDDATFLARLHAHFGDRQGRFVWAGKRASFPLSLKTSKPLTLPRTVLVGNAAQTLHPVAGQGFNIGLRDAWELAQGILNVPRERIGDAAMLAAYASGRRLDTGGGIFFTDLLVRGFSNDLPVLREARAAALSALDLLPPLKDFVVRRMIFGAKG